jgi:hypothetical protein
MSHVLATAQESKRTIVCAHQMHEANAQAKQSWPHREASGRDLIQPLIAYFCEPCVGSTPSCSVRSSGSPLSRPVRGTGGGAHQDKSLCKPLLMQRTLGRRDGLFPRYQISSHPTPLVTP